MGRRLDDNGRSLVGAAALAAALAWLGVPAAYASPAPTDGLHVEASAQERGASRTDPGRRILVSIQQKRLWLVEDGDTLFSAPVAVGKGGVFRFAGRTYEFSTPTGTRRIEAKLKDPNWVPPDWHYFEKAVYRGLEPVHLKDNDLIELSDGTHLEVRDKEVGRINRWGYYHPFTPGSEIIFDGKIFIPPIGSPQRFVPNALGPIKLSMGEGYLIHGTHRYNQESIGTAASHGCIRMRNGDVEVLADLVDVGTRVVIF